MAVNVAFGPAAGIVGQMGFGAGKRQYTDRRDQLERSSKREMLSDAMNFTRFLREGRKPEEDHQRALARMDKQQNLQEKTMDHQAAIQKTTAVWKQGVADEQRQAQAKQLEQLEYDLDQEMLGLPTDMSDMEKQSWRTRAYQKGAHAIGTMRAPGPKIEPYKHFDHDGTMYRQNVDGSVTNVTAEKQDADAKRKTAATESAVKVMKAVGEQKKLAGDPFNEDISALRDELAEVRSSYTGPKSRETPPPEPARYEGQSGGNRDKHVSDWNKKKEKVDAANAEFDAYQKEVGALKGRIEETISDRNDMVNDTAIDAYGSLGVTEGVGGSMTSSLLEKEREKKKVREAKGRQAASDRSVREELGKAVKGDVVAARRIAHYTSPDPGLVPPRTYDAVELAAGGVAPGQAQGESFTLPSSGEVLPAAVAASVFGDKTGKLQRAFGVTPKDAQAYRDKHAEVHPRVQATVIGVGGKKEQVNLQQRHIDMIEAIVPLRQGLKKDRDLSQDKLDKINAATPKDPYTGLPAPDPGGENEPVKNQNIRKDLQELVRVASKLEPLLERQHRSLTGGGGDIFQTGTAISQKLPEAIEARELTARYEELVAAVAKTGGSSVRPEQIKEFRDAAHWQYNEEEWDKKSAVEKLRVSVFNSDRVPDSVKGQQAATAKRTGSSFDLSHPN